MSTLSWSALHCRSNFERRVDSILAPEFECYLPTYHVSRRYVSRHRAELDLPLFAGYTFIRWDQRDLDLRVRLAHMTGVMNLIDGVTEAEIERVRQSVAHAARPWTERLPIGSEILIRSGSLAGVTGIYVEPSRHGPGHIVVSFPMLGRAVRVDLDLDQYDVTVLSEPKPPLLRAATL